MPGYWIIYVKRQNTRNRCKIKIFIRKIFLISVDGLASGFIINFQKLYSERLCCDKAGQLNSALRERMEEVSCYGNPKSKGRPVRKAIKSIAHDKRVSGRYGLRR